ncbi:macrophage receptor MARCO-like [Corticium candelabrum]|uniref:macrophage receptor MARCO-like n=1 Tax=Corticium candelabrum TaxID=121492 RepID=UPI002E26DC89|nr:macrophage receptor MARCO-like [Corticium candelabrum]XP_062512446.1 macrophage receptor MARCO-like [Corticium candelabrum]
MSGSDLKKICFANPTCWMFTLLTALVITNIVFSAVAFLSIRQLKNDVLDIQEQQTVASEMKEQISDMLSEFTAEREKRSASTSSSRLAVDVGSVFVSAIKSMCKPEQAVCIPGAKGEAGQSGRDGLPGATGRDGPVGLRGPPGKPGAKGMGLPGKQGPIGIPGGKGEKGERGEKGGKGHIGGQGIQGVKGIQGKKGERGDRGERGYTGYKGERGEKGRAGDKGIKGGKGNKGIQGEKGILTLPSQCKKGRHRVLHDTWRKVSSEVDEFGYHRDTREKNFQPGWYVFADSIGGQMPQTCPPMHHCGTHAPGWLNGTHPTALGETSKETVCFHWNNNCCKWHVTVEITNCAGVYVYNLPEGPCECWLGYCSDA